MLIPRTGSLLLVVFLLTVSLRAQVYVDTAGNDSNPGTINQPLKTIAKALSVAKADSIVYIRGGIHYPTATISTPYPGTAAKYVKIFAYPGEKVIIDFSKLGTGAKGFNINKDYIHLKGLEIRYSPDNGIYLRAKYALIEYCIMHHNTDSGLQISDGGAYNRVFNCDSYLNYDGPTHGENADGFAAKLNIGPGNIFFGCRAWLNSDDGWDLYEGQAAVLIDYCWAFKNGINIWGDPSFQGDGNGFKIGGNYIPASHTIQRSLAFDNKGKGFDQNNNTAACTVYNNTGYRNTGRNFSFPTAPASGVHVLKNNISFPLNNSIASTSIQTKNSWNGFTVAAADFLNTDTSLVYSPRNSDSTLPKTGFLQLKDTSPLVDAGVDVGLTFNGTAPDLGAYETGPALPMSSNDEVTTTNTFTLLQNYPNPFNPATIISFNLHKRAAVTLSIYDITGIEVASLFKGEKEAGIHNFVFNAAQLSSGVYFAKLSSDNKQQIVKLLFLK